MSKKGMAGMMKQAQKLQAKMAQIQAELAEKQVEGAAGGGMVVVTANGQQDVVGIKIKPEVVDPEDVEMLEDLILAAIAQAQGKAREKLESEMRQATGGMPMPNLGSILGG